MQTNLIRRSLLQHFGLNELGYYWSQTMQDFKQDVADAIVNNQMLVMPGEIGAGKSDLFEKAADSINTITKFVYVRNYYKERCTVSSILNAAVYDLTNYKESPRRDLEARSRQFIRIVGEVVTNKDNPFNVCIVIEEAHRLHANTLRAVKELREARFAGKSPLFSCVLIGFPELMEKVSKRHEVLWRAQAVEFNEEAGWMEYDERVKFLKKVFGEAITNDARKSIASVCKIPLQMISYVGLKMKEAKKAGYKIIDSDVVQPSLKELAQNNNISYGAIAKQSGLPRSTVFDAVNHSNHIKAGIVREAIKNILSAQTASKVA